MGRIACSIAPQTGQGHISVAQRRMTAEMPVRGFRLSPAPAVILCSAPPAHGLEEAIANSESRMIAA